MTHIHTRVHQSLRSRFLNHTLDRHQYTMLRCSYMQPMQPHQQLPSHHTHHPNGEKHGQPNWHAWWFLIRTLMMHPAPHHQAFSPRIWMARRTPRGTKIMYPTLHRFTSDSKPTRTRAAQEILPFSLRKVSTRSGPYCVISSPLSALACTPTYGVSEDMSGGMQT